MAGSLRLFQEVHTCPTEHPAPQISFYKVDPATAGEITGTVRMPGPHAAPKLIDMSEDPACVKAHKGKVYDESLVVGRHGEVDDVFVYVKSGLDGSSFQSRTSR